MKKIVFFLNLILRYEKCKVIINYYALNIINFLKSTKKVDFVALLKYFFNFVPRGTNVDNFFVRKKTPSIGGVFFDV